MTSGHPGRARKRLSVFKESGEYLSRESNAADLFDREQRIHFEFSGEDEKCKSAKREKNPQTLEQTFRLANQFFFFDGLTEKMRASPLAVNANQFSVVTFTKEI